MDRLFKIILSTLLLTAVCAEASAQRTSAGELEATVSLTAAPYSIGTEVSVGTYFLYSYLEGRLSYEDKQVKTSGGEDASFVRLEGAVSWMWRFFGTYSRRFNAYIGGGTFLGWEWLDPSGKLSSVARKALLSSGYSEGAFIYGLEPELSAEFFIFPQIALTAGTSVPVTFNSQSRQVFGWDFNVGVRLNF